MTPAQIEEDKQRWFMAHKLLAETLANRRAWLAQQTDEMREDMQRRLKVVHENKKQLAKISKVTIK
jgi:hypothetical protein